MNRLTNDQYDLIIIGAGMIGSALAIALRDTGLKIAMIEAHAIKSSNTTSFDDRNLVLSLASQRILQRLKLWQKIAANSAVINTIHISEQGRFASVLLEAEQMGLEALAYSLKARDLGQAFHSQFSNIPNLHMLCPATVVDIQQDADFATVTVQQNEDTMNLQARLLVAADGSDSIGRKLLGIEVEQKDYQQQAIVCNVATERAHRSMAYERFNPLGPMALLPTKDKNQSGLVFVVPDSRLDEYMGMDEEAFLQTAGQRFSRRLGRFLKLGSRKHYPLRLITIKEHFKGRALLLGNAAHTIHPNAAQGFNLGLRDVACLAEFLIDADHQRQDLGSRSLLQAYVDNRKTDHDQVIQFTDGLARLFYNHDELKSRLRKVLMCSTEYSPILKQSLMVRAMGLYGQQPAMVSNDG